MHHHRKGGQTFRGVSIRAELALAQKTLLLIVVLEGEDIEIRNPPIDNANTEISMTLKILTLDVKSLTSELNTVITSTLLPLVSLALPGLAACLSRLPGCGSFSIHWYVGASRAGGAQVTSA